MAAVVVVSQSRPHIFGDRRAKAAILTVANTGDTWAIPGIKKVTGFQVTPDTARTCGATVSGSTLTLLTSAGNVSVLVYGT